MTTTTSFGTLTDHTTGQLVRPATADEWLRSALAVNDGRPQGTFQKAVPELPGGYGTVHVEGGPRAEVDDDDIRALEAEAGTRDPEQAALCRRAMEGDADARLACTEVILVNRVESLF